MSFVEIRAVSKTFGAEHSVRHVLHDVNLSVEQGEFVSIIGFMGCGKSTLLNLLAGLIVPDRGEIRFGDEPARGMRNDAAIVFQNYSLLPWFSALENVRLAVAAAFPEWPRRRQAEHARRYLEKVGLATACDRRPSQLSGGMRQRVAIARAFAAEPAMLFLDEPFGALDALTRANLQQELAALCTDAERPVTVIMITNSVEEALLLSDRIVPMTRAPRATLGAPVPVPIPKPRTASSLIHDEHALHIRARIVESLSGVVRPNADRTATPIGLRAKAPSGLRLNAQAAPEA